MVKHLEAFFSKLKEGAALKVIGDKFVIVLVSDDILPSRLKVILMITKWVNSTSKQTNKQTTYPNTWPIP